MARRLQPGASGTERTPPYRALGFTDRSSARSGVVRSLTPSSAGAMEGRPALSAPRGRAAASIERRREFGGKLFRNEVTAGGYRVHGRFHLILRRCRLLG